MRDCCANCKRLKVFDDGRSYPYLCMKEESGIARSTEWFIRMVIEGYKCGKHERRNFGGEE